MSTKQLLSLHIQNYGMFRSLTARNIDFKRLVVADYMELSETVAILMDENIQLKALNKPFTHRPAYRCHIYGHNRDRSDCI